MIKILILDDSEGKIEKIQKVLQEGCALDDENIFVAKSVAAGRTLVTQECFDLVLLDLVLPIFKDGDPEENGGLSFIRELMSAGDRVNIPTQIIGLTEKEDAYKKEKEEFQSLLFSIIHCKQSGSEWVGQVKQAVNYVIRCKDAIFNNLQRRSKYDIGVICALPEEFKQMKAAFGGDEKWKNIQIDEDVPFQFKSTVVATANSHDMKVVAAMAGRPGVIPTSVLSTLMYTLFHVETVFMTGFSAGFPTKNMKLGDILVASSIQDYASGKLNDIDGTIKLLKEIHQIEAATALTLKMQELMDDEETQSQIMSKVKKANLLVEQRDFYQPVMSATCSGPYVVTSEELVKDLQENDRKLEGLDMEGFGLYLTAKMMSNRTQKGALWMKGVGDFANPIKENRYHDTCSFGSAALLYRFIKEKM
ncbi:MAG: 5'-methylthioadenosine/S-adenosylhomocysteine nucleosidase [Bacteroidales bacterium]|nr:5'-methylthioadenosine/S-adenosylhomocysteine nucleosidase [Bacteroidales bacterium]